MPRLNVLIVGAGGREHALAWKIRQSPLLSELFIAPGNGGTKEFNVPIRSEDVTGLCQLAKKNDCFTIVGPEIPLSLSLVDRLKEIGLAVFGPTKEQARLETSKAYAKRFMKENGIPTPSFRIFDEPQRAIEFSDSMNGDVVIKADGLTSGKGVFVCSSRDEALKVINSILVEKIFGDSGRKIIIEDKLEGKEFSLFAICDGHEAIEFSTAVDHKRLLDGNRGPNTGGMGAYSPAYFLSREDIRECMDKIVRPAVRKTGFKGFLYGGLMMTARGPMVLEFNARLGDPETQAILPRLKSDLLSCLWSVSSENANAIGVLEWSSLFSCCVVMCSEGYPYKTEEGVEISGLNKIQQTNTAIFHSGTARKEGKFLTNGGRVLSVVALGDSLRKARERSYSAVSKIGWNGEKHRMDIGLADVN